MKSFVASVEQLFEQHQLLTPKKNSIKQGGNGIYDCYENPILTAEHAPIFWRFDLNEKTNPHLMERQGVRHVATSTVEKLINYCKNTPEDGLRSAASVIARKKLIDGNMQILNSLKMEFK